MTNYKLDSTVVMQAIARWLEAIGQFDRAQQLYQTLIAKSLVTVRGSIVRFKPNDPWAYYKLAKALMQQQRWEEAVNACQRAIEIDPSCPWFYHTLGEAFMGQGLWQDAIDSCQQALALSPETSWIHYTLAKALMGQENWTEAIASCHQAIVLDADVFWFHYTLGEALVKACQWNDAVVALQRANQLQPNFPWTHYYLGEALLAQEKLDEAIAAYEQAIRLRPNNAHLQHSLSYALHLQDQVQKIAAYSERIKDVDTKNGDRPLKILMLTPYPPYPPTLGALARMFHQVKCLGSRHHVVVASLMFAKEDYRFEEQLENYCDLSLMVMLGDPLPREPNQPKLIHRYSSQQMHKILKQLQAIEFDIVSFNFIYMAQYRELFPHAFHVLEEHNIESELLKRCAELNQDNTTINKLAKQVDAVKAFVESEYEAKLLAAYEDEHWQQFPLRSVVSEKDKQILDSRCAAGKTIVVNNGIDTDAVVPIPDNGSKTVLFIGTMSYYPNIDGACYFAEAILPIVWQTDPTIQFWIAGSAPPQQIKDLAQDARIQVFADPEDMGEIAKSCSITVVPLRVGSGTRIKIIHSMAMGLPVVSTSLGCEGLNVIDGTHLLIRDQPKAFAEAVLQLVTNAELRQKLHVEGRQLVEQEYDWQATFAQAEVQMMSEFKAWKTEAIVRAVVDS